MNIASATDRRRLVLAAGASVCVAVTAAAAHVRLELRRGHRFYHGVTDTFLYAPRSVADINWR